MVAQTTREYVYKMYLLSGIGMFGSLEIMPRFHLKFRRWFKHLKSLMVHLYTTKNFLIYVSIETLTRKSYKMCNWQLFPTFTIM